MRIEWQDFNFYQDFLISIKKFRGDFGVKY